MTQFYCSARSLTNGITFRSSKKSIKITRRLNGKLRIVTSIAIGIEYLAKGILFLFALYLLSVNCTWFKETMELLSYLGLKFIGTELAIVQNTHKCSRIVYVLVRLFFKANCVASGIMYIVGNFFRRDWFKYHWAEHAVMGFYQRVGRIPTLKEIERESPYSTNCGSTYVTASALTSISGIAMYHFLNDCIPTEILLLTTYVCSLYIAYRFFSFLRRKTRLLVFSQFFLLKKPDTAHFELAIQGFDTFLKMKVK